MANALQVDVLQYDVTRATADGVGTKGLRGLRDGSLSIEHLMQVLVMEGRCYQVTVGALTTPIQGGGAGTVIDAEQPEFLISVPSGTTIMPFRVHAECQVPLLAADSEECEILFAVDRTQAYTGGTSTAEVAFNLRTDNPRASLCACTSAYTADVTQTVVHGIELARAQLLGDVQGVAANAMWTKFELLYEPAVVPILVGPCALMGYWAGTVAVTGFAQVQWAELSSTAFV